MKKKLLILPLVACMLFACGSGQEGQQSGDKDPEQQGEGGNNSGQQTQTDPDLPPSGKGLSQDDPITGAQAVALMKQAGAGKIVGTNQLYYVQFTIKETTIDTMYHQWYGKDSSSLLELTGATNNSTKTINEIDGSLDGATIIVKGYMEYYDSRYKIGYLPAASSPTGQKFVPSIVSITGEKQQQPQHIDSLIGLTVAATIDFTGAPVATGESNELTSETLTNYILEYLDTDSILSSVTGEKLYQGYESTQGDTSALAGQNVGDCIKTGSSKKQGKISFVLTEDIKGLKITAKGWPKADGSTTDQIGIGANRKSLTTTYAEYEFSFDATKNITIDALNRTFIQKIIFYK